MKKIYQIVYLLVVFCGAVLFFGSRVGETIFEKDIKTVEVGESSFPTVSVLTCGEEVNCLSGYSSNLDTILNREDMIPVGPDGIFELKIKEYDTDVRRLKYEVLDVSSEAEIDSGTINAFEKTEESKIVRIKLKAELKERTEYAVKVTLIGNTGKRMYYYFRIKQYDTPKLTEKLDFIRMFGEKTRSADPKENEEIIPYLETKVGAFADSFHYVDIHDSYKAVSWGELVPELVTEPIISVTEFYDEIMTAVVRYCVKIDAGYGEELYYVEEYFRIRYLGNVVHLLNYERHTEAIFDITKASLSRSELKIGVADAEQVQLYPNSDHSMAAFVRNGSLYCYSLAENSIVTVFPSAYGSYERMCGQKEVYDIRVLKMEGNGDMTFLVSGYMNRGVYEGRVGLFVYRYYKEAQRLEELIYIPVNTTYQILKEELGEFSYLNEYDVFYFMVNRGVYAYNLITEELRTIASDVREGDYVYSVNERFMAYQEYGKTDCVKLLYPETGKEVEVIPGNGEYIKLLGQSEENLIYGYGKNGDVQVNGDGSLCYAMYKVQIKTAMGRSLKVYEKEGYYVNAVETEGNVIRLDRLVRTEDGGYEAAESDYILNQDKTTNGKIALTRRVTDRMLTEHYITFPNGFVMEELPEQTQVLYTVTEKDTTLRINEMEAEESTYYTYYYGMIDGIYGIAGEAIAAADAKVGTVINERGKIVWERGVKATSATVPHIKGVKAEPEKDSKQAALQMMLASKGIAVTPTKEEVQQPLHQVLGRYTNAEVLVLTGATLDEVLYYVWKGQPVLAMKEKENAVVILAYDAGQVTYYDPEKGRNVSMEKDKAEEMFSEAGRLYIGFSY